MTSGFVFPQSLRQKDALRKENTENAREDEGCWLLYVLSSLKTSSREFENTTTPVREEKGVLSGTSGATSVPGGTVAWGLE